MTKPLDGLLVLEFSQYMAGPSAGLRLADLGARVIKIERPIKGEAGRNIATKNMYVDGSSLVFHTANRNKESFAVDLKNEADLEKVKKLIAKADVLTHNFRPGVMEKIGLDFDSVQAINPKLVYATITGYGRKGEWVNKPGQDLLIQSISGLTNLSGNADSPPTPFGVAAVDMLCGTHFVQGILAALIQRTKTKKGAWVEVSLLESAVDFQLEIFTTLLNNGLIPPTRSETNNAHSLLEAPYGIYKTQNSHIAISMGSLDKLFSILNIESKNALTDGFKSRDSIKAEIAEVIETKTTEHWISELEKKNFWCSEVLNYHQILGSPEFETLAMKQTINLQNGAELYTTRCPIRINDEIIYSSKPAPHVGQHTAAISKELIAK